MRTLIPIILLVGLLVAFSAWSAHYLDRTASQLVSVIDTIETLVEEDDWPGASAKISQVRKQWFDVRNKWAIIIDHAEIDNIELSMARLTNLVRTKETPAILAEVAELKKLVSHIPEKELVSLYNLL